MLFLTAAVEPSPVASRTSKPSARKPSADPSPTGPVVWTVAACSLGFVGVAATDRGICRIELDDDPATLTARFRHRFPEATETADPPTNSRLAAWVRQIVAAADAPGEPCSAPLDIAGTPFQRRVWDALRTIPAGHTATYAGVAATIGQPTAVRAVGAACGANPVAIAIPCHRVLRSDGGPGGYRWGLARKKTLLAREAG